MPPRPTPSLLFPDDANASADEIPPLAFEYEDEVRGVLDRLKGELEERMGAGAGAGAAKVKWRGKEKAVQLDDQQRKRMEEMVRKVSTEYCSMMACGTRRALWWAVVQRKASQSADCRTSRGATS